MTMASKQLRSLQAKRAALHHKVESHRAAAFQLFEKAAASMALANALERDMVMLDRDINAIVDTSLNNMAVVHREIHNADKV